MAPVPVCIIAANRGTRRIPAELKRSRLDCFELLRRFVPRRDTPCDQRFITTEIDIVTVADQHGAVAALERRTGNDWLTATSAGLVDPVSDRYEPGRAVVVAEWRSRLHFVNI